MKQVRERQTPCDLTCMWDLEPNNKKPVLMETGETGVSKHPGVGEG